MPSAAIRSLRIAETPFAVIDFETTGLRAGTDRVVEMSVVRVDPGQAPRLVLDTLVNPGRPMAATEIHGITDADVNDAPTFQDIAGDVAEAISGTMVAAYNVYFDLPFLEYEMSTAGQACKVPHLCVMYLRTMLGEGKRCGLDDACACHGITRTASHMASADATAAAQLLEICVKSMPGRSIHTFDDLSRLKDYKFTSSFDLPPLSFLAKSRTPGRVKSRGSFGKTVEISESQTKKNPIAIYWESLAAVLSDLVITDQEVELLAHKKREYELKDEQVRALHARAFAHVINQFIEDRFLDAAECKKLNRLYECLAKLGWAPGQLV